MITFSETGAKMFGGPTPDPSPAPRGGPTTDPAEILFGGTVHAQTNLWNEGADLTQSLDEVRNANATWRSSLSAAHLSQQEGSTVTDLVRQYLNKPADAETQERWRRESSELFSSRYGTEEGRARIATANALAKKDQRLAAALNKSGLGNHPRLLEIFAERAHSLRLAGKL